jgi:hypothetical protein
MPLSSNHTQEGASRWVLLDVNAAWNRIRRVGGGSKFVSERVFRAEGYIVKTRFTPPLLNNISVENECSLSELALAQLPFRVYNHASISVPLSAWTDVVPTHR